MIRYTLAFFEGAALSVMLFGCAPSAHTPPAGYDCVAACINLQSLTCPEGGPTPAGVPCTTWLCETPMPSTRTACISHASTCEDARSCK